MNPAPAQRGDIAEAARVLSALGLVTAFGHVSARSGGFMLITPAADLAGVIAAAIVPVPLDLPDAGPLPGGAPAEAWAHLALYRARPDAGAIARAQPPSTFAAAAAVSGPAVSGTAVSSTVIGGPAGPGRGARLLPLYGQAAWLGEWVPVHDSAHLLRSAELARRAAAGLPAGEALLLRGNGALTLGATPALAVTRMWLLAAACEAWLAAAGAGPVTPLTAAETESWRSVAGELLPRLWQHLRHRALDPLGPGGGPEAGQPANGGRPARPDLGERSQI
ncbi:MAG TPA: class II aldolase/adducin family protein [Streptosporangiaceae bacterium]|nr:class II aldolase/adducin family protein [Streptosporangiaceae bacterium]